MAHLFYFHGVITKFTDGVTQMKIQVDTNKPTTPTSIKNTVVSACSFTNIKSL